MLHSPATAASQKSGETFGRMLRDNELWVRLMKRETGGAKMHSLTGKGTAC